MAKVVVKRQMSNLLRPKLKVMVKQNVELIAIKKKVGQSQMSNLLLRKEAKRTEILESITYGLY
jgi:hypothetical protein